jgi:hypothetical protein
MTISGWKDPAEDDRNPNREAERRTTRLALESRLNRRNIELHGNESDEDVLAIVDAVEAFEAKVALIGGDSFVNAPSSDEPDDMRQVLPSRRDDEPALSYAARVREATERLP